jgi:hypothetical protein
MEWEDTNWIHVAQNRDKCRAVFRGFISEMRPRIDQSI